MSQYKPTVNVTNGSQTMTIPGVDATAEIGAGDLFGVKGDGLFYDVASRSYSAPDTTVTLAANYGGATANNAQGLFVRDFTSPDDIPLLGDKDIETASLVRRALNKIQALFTGISDGSQPLSGPQLSAIDKIFDSSTKLVGLMIYNLADDSDGGAWRERTSHTSWYNETLNTATRGKTRPFPSRVVIVAETDTLTIYDLTDPAVPMWMVFNTASSGTWLRNNTISSLSIINGKLVIGELSRLFIIDFIKETLDVTEPSWTYAEKTPAIEKRNSEGWSAAASAGNGRIGNIVNIAVNDVAITVRPNAPIDSATGLPVPTFLVATNGGVSQISDDGNVWDDTYLLSSSNEASHVEFVGDGYKYSSRLVGSNYYYSFTRNALLTADTSAAPGAFYRGTGSSAGTPDLTLIPGASGTTAAAVKNAIATTLGLNVLKENPATPAEGMIAYITKDYNTGWMPGDIKGAWLADTTAETLVGIEPVTNPEFTNDISNWTDASSAGGSIAWNASGYIDLIYTTGIGKAYQTITAVIGETHLLNVDKISGNSIVQIGSTGVGSSDIYQSGNDANDVLKTFVAPATSITITLLNFNNVGTSSITLASCRLADPDRSVNNNGLQVIGSITKAAVASGANLVGYSGFSANNYLQQPYNADLDFGVGGWCIPVLFKFAPSTAFEALFFRAYWTGTAWSGARILTYIDSSGYPVLSVSDDNGTSNDILTATAAVDDSQWRVGFFGREGNSFKLAINDGAAQTTAVLNAAGSLSQASATLRLGVGQDGTFPAPNGQFALIKPTAYWPSDEQRAEIYRSTIAMTQPGALITLDGSSDAVLALDHDDDIDLLHAMTSYGRSTFNPGTLTRVDSEATSVGTPVAVAASGGIIAQLGSTDVDIYIPAMTLREELARNDARPAEQQLQQFRYTFGAGDTDAVLPVGWQHFATYHNGSLKLEGSADDYQVNDDGYKQTIAFNAAPGAATVVVMARRVVS